MQTRAQQLEEIQRFLNRVGHPMGFRVDPQPLIRSLLKEMGMGESKTRVLKIDYHGKTVLRADYDAVVKGRAYGRAVELSAFPHLCDVESLSGYTRGVVIRRGAQEAQKKYTYAHVIVKPGEGVKEFVSDNPKDWTWAVLTRDGMGFYGCDEKSLAGAWKPYSIETEFRVGGHLFTLKDMQEIGRAFELADIKEAAAKKYNDVLTADEAAKIVHLAPVIRRRGGFPFGMTSGIVITGKVQKAYLTQYDDHITGDYTVLTKNGGNTYKNIPALLRWWRPI